MWLQVIKVQKSATYYFMMTYCIYLIDNLTDNWNSYHNRKDKLSIPISDVELV